MNLVGLPLSEPTGVGVWISRHRGRLSLVGSELSKHSNGTGFGLFDLALGHMPRKLRLREKKEAPKSGLFFAFSLPSLCRLKPLKGPCLLRGQGRDRRDTERLVLEPTLLDSRQDIKQRAGPGALQTLLQGQAFPLALCEAQTTDTGRFKESLHRFG